jgi:D-alanine-D-alanine ligase
MEPQKIRLGILCGGKSAEHEISLLSAKNIVAALDKSKYDVVVIGIDKRGKWHLCDASAYLLNAESPETIALIGQQESVAVTSTELVSLKLDVVFPVLHGTNGEDGTVQGLLTLAGVAFVGAGVLGSAVGMDKDVMKRLLRDAALPVAPFLTLLDIHRYSLSFEAAVAQLGSPFFVKPANSGSSVGISKVGTASEFEQALALAFRFDRKVLLEQFIAGREIVCAVLGNGEPIASLPGEIVPHDEFYTYAAKYLNGASYHIPADLPPALIENVQQMSIAVYRALCCEGMARIDFFLTPEGVLIVNELNSIPGFAPASTYPRMWAASGLHYPQLIDRLIELALERHLSQRI